MEQLMGMFEQWLATGEMNPEAVGLLEEHFNEFYDWGMHSIEQTLQLEQPERALMQMMQVNSFISVVANRRPALIGKLSSKVQQLKAVTEQLGKTLGADSFDIAVGFPVSVSVGLSWDI